MTFHSLWASVSSLGESKSKKSRLWPILRGGLQAKVGHQNPEWLGTGTDKKHRQSHSPLPAWAPLKAPRTREPPQPGPSPLRGSKPDTQLPCSYKSQGQHGTQSFASSSFKKHVHATGSHSLWWPLSLSLCDPCFPDLGIWKTAGHLKKISALAK